MKFHVVGADKESGNDIEIDVTGVDRAEAEAVATKRGVLVCAVEAIKDKDLDPIPLDDIDLAGPAKAAPKDEKGGTRAGVDPALGTTAAVNAPAHAPAHAPEAAGHAPDTHAPPAAEAHAHAVDIDAPVTHAQYHVIMNQSLYLLELAVNKHLKMGWEPQGGLTIGVWNNAMQYFQSMVRHPKE